MESHVAMAPVGIAAEQSLCVRTSLVARSCWDKICFEARDEIWRVCARESRDCLTAQPQMRFSELICGQWHSRTCEEFVRRQQGDLATKTLLYVHGNRTDEEWSVARASQVYQNLFYRSNRTTPLRFVIWQWKSDSEAVRPLVDYEIKSQRAKVAGKTLSQLLNQLDDQNVILAGYSLGAQVILSALSSHELKVRNAAAYFKLVLIAPVLDCRFTIQPACIENRNLPVSQTLIFSNQFDKVIRFAENGCRKSGHCRCGRPGFISLISSGAFTMGPVFEYEISGEVENRHSIVNYTSASSMRASVNELLQND